MSAVADAVDDDDDVSSRVVELQLKQRVSRSRQTISPSTVHFINRQPDTVHVPGIS